jgi:hypothetical protein
VLRHADQVVFLAILVRTAFRRLAMRPSAILSGSSSISLESQSSMSYRASRTRTTVPSRIRRTMSSPARSRRAHPPVGTHLAPSPADHILPTAPANKPVNARLIGRVTGLRERRAIREQAGASGNKGRCSVPPASLRSTIHPTHGCERTRPTRGGRCSRQLLIQTRAGFSIVL